jgi:hypothetical protein
VRFDQMPDDDFKRELTDLVYTTEQEGEEEEEGQEEEEESEEEESEEEEEESEEEKAGNASWLEKTDVEQARAALKEIKEREEEHQEAFVRAVEADLAKGKRLEESSRAHLALLTGQGLNVDRAKALVRASSPSSKDVLEKTRQYIFDLREMRKRGEEREVAGLARMEKLFGTVLKEGKEDFTEITDAETIARMERYIEARNRFNPRTPADTAKFEAAFEESEKLRRTPRVVSPRVVTPKISPQGTPSSSPVELPAEQAAPVAPVEVTSENVVPTSSSPGANVTAVPVSPPAVSSEMVSGGEMTSGGSAVLSEAVHVPVVKRRITPTPERPQETKEISRPRTIVPRTIAATSPSVPLMRTGALPSAGSLGQRIRQSITFG